MTKKISVLVVDDHALVREGLSLMINLQPDLEVVGEATTGREAVELFKIHRPAVTLMDLRLPDFNGVQAIEQICAFDSTARILVLTTYGGDEEIYRALHAGAFGYLLKDVRSSVLVDSIRRVHEGQRSLSPEIASKLATRIGQPSLTARELQVMNLLPNGLRNKEIAAELHISEDTVQVHVKNIFTKLGVNDRAAAVTVALRRGIIALT